MKKIILCLFTNALINTFSMTLISCWDKTKVKIKINEVDQNLFAKLEIHHQYFSEYKSLNAVIYNTPVSKFPRESSLEQWRTVKSFDETNFIKAYQDQLINMGYSLGLLTGKENYDKTDYLYMLDDISIIFNSQKIEAKDLEEDSDKKEYWRNYFIYISIVLVNNKDTEKSYHFSVSENLSLI